jgi:hypothetical protein
MATSSIALGQLSRLAMANEPGAYGVAATTGYRYAFYYAASLRETKPIEADPVIGAGYHNFRDATPPAPSQSEHGGQVTVPVCLNQIGDWLRMIFGAPATSGSVNFTHVFSSGALILPTSTIEMNPIASDFRQHVGLAARSLRLDLAGGNGFQRAEIDMLGFGETLLGSSAAGTPTAARAYDPIKATGAAVFLGGTQIGVLLSASINYETGLMQDRYIDATDKFGAAILAEQAQLSGELRVRYTGPTFDAAAVAETDQALEIRMIRTVNNSLVLAAPAVRLGRAGVPISGPGGIEQSIPFRAAQTSGAAMFSATLKNQIATY